MNMDERGDHMTDGVATKPARGVGRSCRRREPDHTNRATDIGQTLVCSAQRAVLLGVLGTVLLSASAATVADAQNASPSSPPEKIALSGGRIILGTGEEIERGTILIERGRITAIGAEVEIPYDFMEFDVSGKVLMPGMINPHDYRGLDIANESLPVTPFLDVYDAIDPSRVFFEDSLRDGVTTVHVIAGDNTVISGTSRVVRPIGLTVEEMTVMPDIALKLSTTPRGGYDRMRQIGQLRETFRELDDYLEQLAESKYEEQLKKENKQIDVGPAEAAARGRALIRDADYDDRHANLVRLHRGDLAAFIYCGAATDVKPAIDIATEQGFLSRTVFVLGGNAHLAVREIAATGRPVVLPPDLMYRERDPDTGKINETFLPRVFYDAGVAFALQPHASGSMAERYLNYQAAMCIRHGIPRDAALRAITLTPAEMIGLESRLGALEAGRIANIVVMSADPFDFSSWVEHVYIDGVLAYERDKDPRLQKILEVEARNAPAPAPAATDAPPAENDNGNGGNGGEGGE